MAPGDIIARAFISDVWQALGGGPLRYGRGVAWWRGDDGPNVALDDARDVWFDHARGQGGGVLDLIQSVLGCNRREALQWLADHQGVALDDRPWTRSERQQYAQRRAKAQVVARGLAEWRRSVLRELRAERNRLFMSENIIAAAARTLLTHEGGGDDDEEAWAQIWRCALDDLKAESIDRKIQPIENASPAELVAMRRATESGS